MYVCMYIYIYIFLRYHAPQKYYLPEKILPDLFLKLLLPDLSFFRINFEKLPGTLCICVSCMTLPA